MENTAKTPTGLLHSTDKLRQLIIENPELPLLVFSKENPELPLLVFSKEKAGAEGYCWRACGEIEAAIGEFMDCFFEDEDEVNCFCRVFTSRADLEEAVEKLCEIHEINFEECSYFVRNEMEKYEPYWKPCIILTVGNH